MSMPLKDLLCFDYFKNLQLIAGSSGLSQPVESCGILDYEMEQSVSEKYMHQNFNPHQLALTSLLFAKNNPFLLRDAVKYLISRNVSGLIIKNVFHIPIHDSVLRYANSKGFPIFLINHPQIYFEEFILQVDKCITIAENSEVAERELNHLLYQPMELDQKKTSIRRLFPRFYDRYVMLYVCVKQTLPAEWLSQVRCALETLDAQEMSKSILRYQDGFFVFLSRDRLVLEEISDFAAPLAALYPEGHIGVSGIQFHIEEMDEALREALFASQIHRLEKERRFVTAPAFLTYPQLGVYRVLLPLIDREELQHYSSELLEPVLEFDAENRGNLLETLLEFVQCGGSLHKLSEYSGQHENTLRYRLDKIGTLTGLSYRKPGDYEQLALAARVYLVLQQ